MRPRTKSGTARPTSARIPDTNVAINHATKRVRMSVPTISCTGGISTSASLRISLNLCHHRVCSSDCSVPSKMRLGSGSRASFLPAPAVVTKSDRRLRTVDPVGRRATYNPTPSRLETRKHITSKVIQDCQILVPTGCSYDATTGLRLVYAALALPIPAMDTFTRTGSPGSTSDRYLTRY